MLEPPGLERPTAPGAVQTRTALLINPFYPKDPHASFGKHVLTPSLALTSIAATTPEHWQVEYWDENLLQGPPPTEPVPQVVGISVHLTFAKRAYALAEFYRALGSIVVFGGLHVQSCTQECARHCDILALGDGVQLWGQILADIDAGSWVRTYHAGYRRGYEEDPPPRRDLLPRRSFLTTTSMIATRGCHNRCGFCYLATDGLQLPYSMRRVQQVVDEFVADGQPYGVFVDNNLGSRRDYLRRLCRALRPIDKIWSAAVSIDVTDEPDLVREMALAGCVGVFIGFESLTNANLTAAGKKGPRPADYPRRVRLFHDHGIQVNGSFVLGFDHDGPDVFERTVQWVEDNRLECATYHILTPYPSTPFFRRLKTEQRILHEDWEQYDTSHAVFQPAQMSPEELEAGYDWCYRRTFSAGSIWRRRPRELRAVPAYLGMSVLYKRANWLWPYLIEHRLTSRAWRLLVELSRWRHLRYRKRLARREPVPTDGESWPSPAGVS